MALDPATLARTLVVSCVLASACGAGRAPLALPQLPPPATWKTMLGGPVHGPLASDGRRILVASRDDVVRSLDAATGVVAWVAEGQSGRVSAAAGTILVRAEDGRLTSLHPRSGAVRWQAQTGVAGALPAVIDEDRALVAGEGLAAVELASGRVLWSDRSGATITAPPVRAGTRLLTGESDGRLRCRSRDTGVPLWTQFTRGVLLAPPLVDLQRGRAYVGTTDRRIVEVSLDDGDAGWRWRVGADIAFPGLLLDGRVLFASHEAVLWALRDGGNLAWRSSLPSRPLSGPLLAGGYLIVACLEKDVALFDPATGKRLGSFQTGSEIRTPPLVAGDLVAFGLRDRSVVAYGIPGTPAGTPPAGTPVPAGPAPGAPAGTPAPGTTPAPGEAVPDSPSPAPVEARQTTR